MASFEIRSYYSTLTGKEVADCNLNLTYAKKMISLTLPTVPPQEQVINIQHIDNLSYDDKNGFVCIWSMENDKQPKHQIVLSTKRVQDAKSIAFGIRGGKGGWVMLGSTYGLGTTENFFVASLRDDSQNPNKHPQPSSSQQEEEQKKEEGKEEQNPLDGKDCADTRTTGDARSEWTVPDGGMDENVDEEKAGRPLKRQRLGNTEGPAPINRVIEQFDSCRNDLVRACDWSQAQEAELDMLKSHNTRLEKELEVKEEKLRQNVESQSELSKSSETIRKLESRNFAQCGELQSQRAELFRQSLELDKFRAQKDNLQTDIESLKDLIGMCISVVDPDKFLIEIKNGSSVADAHVAAIRKK